MDDFLPRRGLAGGHRMTLFAWGHPRPFQRLPAHTIRYFDVTPGTRLLAHCHWQPRPWECPTLLALHGLESSSSAHYMLGIADKAFARGFNIVRLNQRTCGGTEHLAAGLYHSGLTADPAAVVRELIEVDGLTSIGVAGYSLGGNLALKLAGEYGSAAPAALRSVCAVSPTVDLAGCVRALERRENWLYQRNFVRHLKRRMRRKARLFPHLYDVRRLHLVRTVRAFDERFTAPHHGFRDADDYYHRASAMQVIDRIQVPTLIVTASDDPVVPAHSFRDRRLVDNPYISLVVTRFGGHCGFVSSASGADDGYWAEGMCVEFLLTHATSAFSQRPLDVFLLKADR